MTSNLTYIAEFHDGSTRAAAVTKVAKAMRGMGIEFVDVTLGKDSKLVGKLKLGKLPFRLCLARVCRCRLLLRLLQSVKRRIQTPPVRTCCQGLQLGELLLRLRLPCTCRSCLSLRLLQSIECRFETLLRLLLGPQCRSHPLL